MLKRIAMINGDDTLREALVKATNEKGLIVAPEVPNTLPAGTMAVVAGGDDPAAAAEAALAVAEQHEELLMLVAAAIDCREDIPEGSSLRVREHATRFAQAVGLSDDDQLILERASLVRDIGKLSLSNKILLKNTLLTYEEWTELKRHPHMGAEKLSTIDALKDTAEVVRHHHECFDGDGYPDNLEGEAIPYLARMLKILDVYCAMTSPRHYRKGQATVETALDHLQSEAGKHFDKVLVDRFIQGNVAQV